MSLDPAGPASHFAAPLETAVAVHFRPQSLRLVAPAAAEQLAAVHAGRGAVALPASRPQRARESVRNAKVRGFLRVDEILFAGRLDARPFRDDGLPVVPRDHFGRPVKLVLETDGHVPEDGQLPPAGPQGAGSGQSVTFAFGPHVVLHGLYELMATLHKDRKDFSCNFEGSLTSRPASLLWSITWALRSPRLR